MGTKRKRKSQKWAKSKERKEKNKHTRRCKCLECSDKREKRTWNRRQAAGDKGYADEVRRKKESRKKGNVPGFLAGGHPNIKRDFTFEPSNKGEYQDVLSPYHAQARRHILKMFPGNKLKDTENKLIHPWNPMAGQVLFRAYQMDMNANKFNAVKGKVELDWHGTKFFNINSIGHSGLETRGAYGFLGSGIYLAPTFLKAWNFSGTSFFWSRRPFSSFRTVLLCATKLGKVLDSKNCMTHAVDCKKGKRLPRWGGWGKCSPKCKWHKPNVSVVRRMGFDSASASRGYHPGAYRTNLIHTEYCAYDTERVLPLYVLVFSQEGR